MQFTNSGGISAAALPTPFDQPGGPGSAAAAAAAAAAAVSAAGHAHPLALHQQQAAAAAAYVAALQAQAAQATAAQDQYTAAMAAAAAEHAYLVCPPPVPQAPLQIMVGKVRPDSDTDFLCLHTDFLCLRACPGLPPCLLGWCGIGCTRHGAGHPVQDYLSPWEQQLAGQINAMNLPVHVEVRVECLCVPPPKCGSGCCSLGWQS